MAYLKRSDIEMVEEDGTFQLSIGDHFVTEGNFKSADTCYRDYLVHLINGIENARAELPCNTGF